MYVMKFSAASVSDVQRLGSIAELCKLATDSPYVVVCAALDGMTDRLISAARQAADGNESTIELARRDLWSRHKALAEKLVHDEWEREALYNEWASLLKMYDRVTRAIVTLGDSSGRGVDAVAALGERFATHLVAVVLRQGGIPAQVVDAAEIIVTDEHFGAARPLPAESSGRVRKRLKSLLQARIVPVITGYIGATPGGVVTTLGRGGGDYTAALIAAAMGAAEVWIWTDVDGILTADPKIVKSAHSLPEISFGEASEIASFGAEVLHPRALLPLANTTTTLRIRSALQPSRPGTAIVARPAPTDAPARALISTRGLHMLMVTGTQDWPTDLAWRTIAQLHDAGIDILTAVQHYNERSFAFAVRASDAQFAEQKLAAALDGHLESGHIITKTKVALIAVIAAGSNQDLMPRTLATLGKIHTHLLTMTQSTHSDHISFLVPDDETEAVVSGLHKALEMA